MQTPSSEDTATKGVITEDGCYKVIQGTHLGTWRTLSITFRTFELDSLGRRVSKMLRFLLCASMSTKMTDQEAPFSPNKLQPLMASSAALARPMELPRVAILLAGDDLLASEKVELGVQGKLWVLSLLEVLHVLTLSHPAGEDSPHALDAGLAQLICLPSVIVNSSANRVLRPKIPTESFSCNCASPVCLEETPYGRSAVYGGAHIPHLLVLAGAREDAKADALVL
ncbi:hypothetical protein E2C01_023421 [Portunus trituberculatus]|uniref:Uncharacterized protein n=1 Tax=Portunus trituberculatus TaxID=210409 RepID=A0A5B7EB37_PORTR|nr:hypothetical protein [Portunus trituberculatus]